MAQLGNPKGRRHSGAIWLIGLTIAVGAGVGCTGQPAPASLGQSTAVLRPARQPTPSLSPSPRGRDRRSVAKRLPRAPSPPGVLPPVLNPEPPRRTYQQWLRDGRGERYSELTIDGHVHSTYSGDAVMTPDRVLRLAVRRRLDAMVFTDHNSFGVFTHPLTRPPGLIVLFGMEIGAQDVHIGAWNLTRKIVVRRGDSLRSVLARIREQPNTLAVLNHPGWRIGAQVFSPRYLEGALDERFDALEIWNASFWQNVAPNLQRWEAFLSTGLYVPIIGSSDSHYGRIGRPHTVLYVVRRDAEGIVDAARRGRGYITDDARLNFTVNRAIVGQRLRVAANTPLGIEIQGQSRYGGTLRLYWRRQLPSQRVVEPGAFALTQTLPATVDGWFRVEMLRLKPVRYGRMRFTYTLLTNPILVDVAPFGDFWRTR